MINHVLVTQAFLYYFEALTSLTTWLKCLAISNFLFANLESRAFV